MRFRLRTLLIVLAVGPPLIWAGWSLVGLLTANPEPGPLYIGEGGYIWVYEHRNGQLELVDKHPMFDPPPKEFRLSR